MSTILIVGNDRSMLEVMAGLLQQHNYDVLCATNGKEAIERLAQTDVDLVLTNLPKMDGLSLLKHIRHSEIVCHIPVIICSNHLELTQHEAHSYGATAFLLFPLTAKIILEVVRQTLHR